jgi:homoserine kinase
MTLTVRAPASCGNLGSGFDALSLAVEVCNEFSAEPAAELAIENRGEGAEGLSTGKDHLVYRAIRRVFEARGEAAPAVRLWCDNRIPLSRGMGSSSSAIVAGLLLGNRLLGDPLGADELLSMATAMEGHPDNVVSCLLGGVQVSVMAEGGGVLHCGVPINTPLRAVLFVPELRMDTKEARRLLPKQVPLADAVFNLSRSALLVAALAGGRAELLRAGLEDRLHQPYRSAIFPAMPRLFDAALDAGAVAACLSGAGSTVLALADEGAERVAEGMERCATGLGIAGTARVVGIRQRGAEIVEG